MLCDFALLGQLLYWSRAPKTARALAMRPGLVAYLARMAAVREQGRARCAAPAAPHEPPSNAT